VTRGEKRLCATCDEEVEVVDEARDGDVVDQKLSCGHTSKRTIRNVQESLSLKEIVRTIVTGTIFMSSFQNGLFRNRSNSLDCCCSVAKLTLFFRSLKVTSLRTY
jgi:hypothetical protein